MISKWILKQANIIDKVTPSQSEYVGKQASYVGIALNICLSFIKILTGLFFQSISILADGINNLSDAGNSLILLISFKYSNLEADAKHPYGHARFEYLASCIVAVSIVLLSVEIFKSSIDKIMNPTEIQFSLLLVSVLIVSILGKYVLYKFYINCANAIDSTVLQASAKDSINDAYSTLAVFISIIIQHYFNINLDGYIGLFVSGIILMSAFSILKEAFDKILGQAPDKEFVSNIEKRICEYEGIYGIHDLMVHSYGPNRLFVSAHVEVDSKEELLVSHDRIDAIERDFLNEGIHLVIHLDPIVLDNPLINQLKEEVIVCVKELSDDITIHDFRAVLGNSYSKLIFDCMIPYSCKISKEEIQEHIDTMLSKKEHPYYSVITFERPFNG